MFNIRPRFDTFLRDVQLATREKFLSGINYMVYIARARARTRLLHAHLLGSHFHARL